jgi:hypothetical protein
MTQQHADRPPWRCALVVWVNLPVFQNARVAPASSQADQAWIADSMFDNAEYPSLSSTPTAVLQIRLQHPSPLAPGHRLRQRRQGRVSAQPRPSPTRARQNILLVDGGEHLGRTALERPIGHTRHPQGALCQRPGLRAIDPPSRRCVIPLTVHRLPRGLKPCLELLRGLRHRLAIHPGG